MALNLVKGTELVLEASGASISDGGFAEANDDDRQSTDNAGYPFGIFEFDTAAGGFSAAPTEGAIINLYEQTINSDSNDAPDVDANNRNKYIGSFVPDLADAQQYLVLGPVPINLDGGKYWLEWIDGGSGTASIDSGWDLRLTPVTYSDV